MQSPAYRDLDCASDSSALAIAAPAAEAKRPNIVFIFSDDHA